MALFESFADVLHNLVDKVGFSDEEAEKAHAVIDTSSGQRTQEPPQAAPAAPEAPAQAAPAETAPAGDSAAPAPPDTASA